MARFTDVMMLDGEGFMPSLAALDVLSGVKAAETVTPTVPTPASSDTKLSAQAATVPQAAVPAGSVNTNTIEGINAASNNKTTAQPFTTPMTISGQTDGVVTTGNTPEAIDAANAKVIDIGGLSTDPANRLPGESASEANARITAAYKAQPKPELTKEGAAAGATIKFVRTGAGGVGKWMEVFPIGKPIPAERTTEYGNVYDAKGNLVSGTGLKTGTGSATATSTSTSGTKGVQQMPPGFTAGAFPKELEKYFGASPSDIMGYKINEYTNAAGEKYYKLSISQKGAYGDAKYGSSEFGAPIKKDASGAFTLFQGNYSTGSNLNDGSTTTKPTTSTTTVTTTKPITSTTTLTTTPVAGANYGGSGSTADPFTVDGKPYTGSLFGSTYNNGVVVDMAAKTADDIAKQGRLDARTEFSNTLKALGLPQNLVDELDNMIKQDYTKSQMYLELQKTPAWKERFPGMAGLAAAGKAVDAGTYISMEKGFLQTLDYYGIDKKIFGTTAELGKQIGNLVSPKAFEDRVSLAAQDVEQNPDVLSQLNLYYGVDKSAAISYLLNPEIGLDIIKRQARAAEIGAKAAASKFDFGTAPAGSGVAESFINAAGTMDLQSLGTAFQQARQLAGNQTRLAQLEGASYNDLEAVSAILGKDQAAILDSQRRAAREAARFGGGSGLGSGSLKRETAI